MNKAELVERLSRENKITKVASQKILNATLNLIKSSLKRGEDVKISGFGKWYVTKRKARTSKNPQTGEMIKVAAQKVPAFRAGRSLKTVLNP